MNMVDAVKSVLTQYIDFSGRARRSEYWYWVLATILAGVVVGIIELILGVGSESSGPLSSLLNLAIFLPGMAVGFRRLHDTGRSGWWIGGFYIGLFVFAIIIGALFGASISREVGTGLAESIGVIAIIFGIGALIYMIVLLVFFCSDSDVGPNKYGPNPKNEGNYDIFE